MTRNELAEKVARDTQSYKGVSKDWTIAVLDCLADAITTEKEVKIRNLGTFEHIVRKPKVGRNYKTGERVEIPAKMIIQFTPCDRIQEIVLQEPTGYENKAE